MAGADKLSTRKSYCIAREVESQRHLPGFTALFMPFTHKKLTWVSMYVATGEMKKIFLLHMTDLDNNLEMGIKTS